MEDRIRVLIVDDSETTREMMDVMLSEKDDIEIAGYAQDGVEAL